MVWPISMNSPHMIPDVHGHDIAKWWYNFLNLQKLGMQYQNGWWNDQPICEPNDFLRPTLPPKHRRASCARWKFRCKKMIEDELSGGFHVGRRTTQSTWAANMMNANECQWTSPAQVDHYLRGTHQLQIAKLHSTVRDKSSSFRLALARSNLQLPKCWYYSSLYLVPSPPFHIVLSSPGQLHISPSTGTTG